MENGKKKKLLVIVGPTASGKSDLAVFLALRLAKLAQGKLFQKKYEIKGAEIISADSRQVYKYMDIGTGKVTKKEMGGIPHYMLDVAHPSRQFTVAQYKKKTEKIIRDIQKRGKLPILVGGTGFYIDSVVYDMKFPEVKANKELRDKLSNKSTEELFEMLSKKDPARAKTIEAKNKRRLIRALEIIDALGHVPEMSNAKTQMPNKYNALLVGIKVDKELLHERIEKRLDARLKQGMVTEVKRLREDIGISWKRLENFGLEYRWIARYLQGGVSKEEMRDELARDIKRYGRRQIVWFKRNKNIKWIELENKKQLQKETEELVRNFTD